MSRIIVLIVAAVIIVSQAAQARRAIPDNNLAYPVLIITSGGSIGSGCYLHSGRFLYLLTADHVIYDSERGILRGDSADLLSYGPNLEDSTKSIMRVRLKALEVRGKIRRHAEKDIVVIQFGATAQTTDSTTSNQLFPEVLRLSDRLNFTTLERPLCRVFAEVEESNDVYLFGFPTSLSLHMSGNKGMRPLLRRGIIAGKHQSNKTIIIDCPVYGGNSGGPVTERYTSDDGKHHFFKVIGLVSAAILQIDEWHSKVYPWVQREYENSGYAEVIPIDYALELIDEMEAETGETDSVTVDSTATDH